MIPQLSNEIILYILSYLPLSSLFKFKSVCKLWNTLFLHPRLPFFHYGNSDKFNLDDVSDSWYKKCSEDEKRDGVYFTVVTTSRQALYLLRRTTSIDDDDDNNPLPITKSRYRIQCSILRQGFDIPNPQNPSLSMSLDYVTHNRAVKLVSVHEHGYEILALPVGTWTRSDPSSYSWRPVFSNIPNLSLYEKKRKRIEVFIRMGVAYCIWDIERDGHLTDDIQIDVLDIVNEIYIGHTTFPRGSGLSTNIIDWNGQLSIVEQVKDELHVSVLNDYRNLRWDETRRIIKLKFLKLDDDNKELMTFITFADNCILFFLTQDKKSFYSYDTNTGYLKTTVTKTSSGYNSADVLDVIEMLMFYKGAVFYDY